MVARGPQYEAEEGLKCPECRGVRLQVVDSRPFEGTIRRRRKCGCGAKFSTIEFVIGKGQSAAQVIQQADEWRRLYEGLLARLKGILINTGTNP
jgi:transcriptional regulator NrdR family protein